MLRVKPIRSDAQPLKFSKGAIIEKSLDTQGLEFIKCYRFAAGSLRRCCCPRGIIVTRTIRDFIINLSTY